jgi:hypothetical protein
MMLPTLHQPVPMSRLSSAISPLRLYHFMTLKKTPLYFYANEDVTASNCPKNPNILGTLVTLNISTQ